MILFADPHTLYICLGKFRLSGCIESLDGVGMGR